MAQQNTRERLLDAAEELIATKGYSGTSLREVTGTAGANLAAVHYHFGSKEGLAEAVLKRQLLPLNDERLKLLAQEMAAAHSANRLPDVDTLMRIFIGTVLRHIHSGARGKRLVRIVSRLHTDPDATLRHLFIQTVQQTLDAFFKALHLALPHLPQSVLFARIIFSFGAMGHAANLLSDGQLRSEAAHAGLPRLPDAQTFYEELVGFVSRGMKMPCQESTGHGQEVTREV